MSPSVRPKSAESLLIEVIFQSLPGLVFVAKADGRFVRWNRGYESLLGWSDEEMANMCTTDTLVPKDRERIRAITDQILSGEEFTIQLEALARDGHTVPMNVSGVMIEVDGQPHVFGTGTDLSEHLAAEVALAQSEQRYRQIFNATNEAVMIHDATGAIVDVNERTLVMFGCSREEILGMSSDRFCAGVSPYSPKDAAAKVQRAIHEGPQLFEWQSRKANGEIFWSEVALHASEIGGQPRIIAAVRDINERKRAEAQQQEDQRRLAMAVSATQDAVWESNAQTGVTYFSPRWYEMLGYPVQKGPQDLQAWTKLCHPDDVDAAVRAISSALKDPTKNKWETNYRYRRADGTWAWIYGRGAVTKRDADGRPVVVYGTNSDITERKQAEEERERLLERLRQSQKLESIGRLAGGVAHDFNNLLTAIRGNVSLALMDEQVTVGTRELLEEADRAADSAANLTRQLLTFSRRQIIEPKVVNLNDTVARLEKMLCRLIGEDIELSVTLAPDLGTTRIDEGQLEQVLVNLAVNARDAMPQGGKLTVETTNATLDDEYCCKHEGASQGNYVLLSVSDEGSGMTPEVRERIFEPFFTTKDVGKGTGLGLSMVYGAIQQNHGTIDVYSEVGQGTTVHVYLPRSYAPQEQAIARLTDAPKGGRETILLVEDAEYVRHLATRVLSRQGYRVLAYADGSQALAAIQDLDQSVELLLTDVVMPGMNGRELAERVTAARPGIRVLYASGYSETAILTHGVLDESIEFIAKPYSVEQLTRRVRAVLDKPNSSTPSRT